MSNNFVSSKILWTATTMAMVVVVVLLLLASQSVSSSPAPRQVSFWSRLFTDTTTDTTPDTTTTTDTALPKMEPITAPAVLSWHLRYYYQDRPETVQHQRIWIDGPKGLFKVTSWLADAHNDTKIERCSTVLMGDDVGARTMKISLTNA